MLFMQFSQSWLSQEYHHHWLEDQGRQLLAFYKRARCERGGFTALDDKGYQAKESQPDTMQTARMTHCFALASLQGEPGAAELAQWGVDSLLGVLKDTQYGGWLSTLPERVADERKASYIHVFVTLAGCSASLAGIPRADELYQQAVKTLETHFWMADEGALCESYTRDWQDREAYRGGNSNMHCTELFLQLADFTGNPLWRERALAIIDKVIHQHAPANHYFLAEHFHEDWQEWHDYNKDKPTDSFHPYGVTPGHACEWARLLLHLEAALQAAGEPVPAWLLTDAKGLFHAGISHGWHVDGTPGIVYTHDWEGKPVAHSRVHWTLAESCGTAASLLKRTGEQVYEEWYRRLWDYIGCYMIDTHYGSWWQELDQQQHRSTEIWSGKPDLYHAWQLTQISRLPLTPMIGLSIKQGHHQR
ncbi:AGE family epimerase/isomerase [Rosenbergiella epipactidis]|uniref:AGE family epimerase/isomerase n=1 Tax=Rosenbergiella epipactidis TaxID=1544694 RepID=UPI001F4EE06A|nr:AGE family epimerase/isomerase [Rosenbergiella epipactidis]